MRVVFVFASAKVQLSSVLTKCFAKEFSACFEMASVNGLNDNSLTVVKKYCIMKLQK